MGSEIDFSSLQRKDLGAIYQSFQKAFSDYLIKFEMTQVDFEKKFVEKLQMAFDDSGGAWHNGSLIGFIFTAIENYEGLKTAYNGGTGVVPEYRGQDISGRLYQHLLPRFQKSGIRKCLLEVITTNSRAIKAYQKLGFEKTRIFKCYKIVQRQPARSVDCSIKMAAKPDWVEYDRMKDFEPSFLDINNKVQNNLRNERIMESWHEGRCAGYAIYQSTTGRISQLAVRPDLRGNGFGSELIRRIQSEATNRTVTIINVPEGEATNQALSRIGFENQLDQYEMELGL